MNDAYKRKVRERLMTLKLKVMEDMDSKETAVWEAARIANAMLDRELENWK